MTKLINWPGMVISAKRTPSVIGFKFRLASPGILTNNDHEHDNNYKNMPTVYLCNELFVR